MESLHLMLAEKVAKITANARANRKQLITSVISLILSAMILITASVSWFTINEATIDGGVMRLDAGNGLRVNDGEEESNLISLKNDSELIPASSVDGYNLYFPQDGTFSSKTTSMQFRSANVGDKNVHFIQVDFTLTADANQTDVFIDTAKSFIKVDGSIEKASALRVAFLDERNREPIILNPYANSSDYTKTVNAVKNVAHATGQVTEVAEQVSQTFSAYSTVSNNPIVSLSASESTKISVIIWLEGTDPTCVNSISGKDLDISIVFTSSWENPETITFIDDTTDNWLSNELDNGNSSMILEYIKGNGEDVTTTTFVMYKNSEGWYCNIPQNATSRLIFKRVDAENNVLQVWSIDTTGASTEDRGTSTTYYAYDGTVANNAQTYQCTGYWLTNDTDSDIEKDDVGDLDDIFG